jgi:hypothetical protein
MSGAPTRAAQAFHESRPTTTVVTKITIVLRVDHTWNRIGGVLPPTRQETSGPAYDDDRKAQARQPWWPPQPSPLVATRSSRLAMAGVDCHTRAVAVSTPCRAVSDPRRRRVRPARSCRGVPGHRDAMAWVLMARVLIRGPSSHARSSSGISEVQRALGRRGAAGSEHRPPRDQ